MSAYMCDCVAKTPLRAMLNPACVCWPLQCEAMQFSMMTFFPDRPDILSLWRVRLEADASSCPVLLSNGNVTEAGKLPDGRHFSVWEVRLPAPLCWHHVTLQHCHAGIPDQPVTFCTSTPDPITGPQCCLYSKAV